jgi:putative oxidoreductase
MVMAYVTADREALFSIISDPDKFYAAAPYVFLIASLIILIFGPGKFCVDYLLRRFAHLPTAATTEARDL